MYNFSASLLTPVPCDAVFFVCVFDIYSKSYVNNDTARSSIMMYILYSKVKVPSSIFRTCATTSGLLLRCFLSFLSVFVQTSSLAKEPMVVLCCVYYFKFPINHFDTTIPPNLQVMVV